MRAILPLLIVASLSACSNKKDSCDRTFKAFGITNKGHPNLVPKDKAELDASIADVDERVAAYDGVRADAHPEVRAAGDKLAATLRETGEMLRRPPKARPAPSSEKQRALEEAMEKATAEGGLGLPPSLYDMSGSPELSQRMTSAWAGVVLTCD